MQPEAQPASSGLERFDGRVDRISGDTASITLISPKGERLSGTYPAQELAAHEIHEGDRFTLTTVAEGDALRFDLRLIPRREITPERLASIQDEVRRELGGSTSDDED